jgi:hypothetical protein
MALFCAPAEASGRTPPLPLASETFESQAACATRLETLYAQDKAMADPQPIPAENGETRQRIVRSEGVQRVDGRNARYSVHVGYEIRIPLPGLQSLRTTHSYEERAMICVDRRLTGERADGEVSRRALKEPR